MLINLARILFFPLTLIYGAVIRVRNYLFDNGILQSVEPGVPVISVGNITVGGTGKTPRHRIPCQTP
ncbi:MAG: tetraacyldisaccharide 4'-kinase [Bacteroidales bacterium]